MPEGFKKSVSYFLIMAILAVTMSLFAGNASHADGGKHTPSVSKVASVETQSPCCPCDSDHSSSDHCNSFCSCVCHAHLPVAAVQFASSLIVVPLQFHESFKAIPEVHLPKFVPPHILA